MPADFGSPVAAGVDVSPNKGLTTLSDLMGLQQKQIGISQAQQTLQTGQFMQQQQQAEAQKQQQAMATRQVATKMAQTGTDPDGNSIIDPTTKEMDPVKFSSALFKTDPINAAPIVQNILKTTNDKFITQSTGLKLDAQQRQMLAGPLQALNLDSSDANVSNVRSTFGQFLQQHPEMGPNVASANALLDHIQGQTDQKKRGAMANSFSALLQGGVQVQTQPTAGTMESGQEIIPGTQAPAAAGGAFTPSGPTIEKKIAPQLVTPPGGVPTPYKGSGPVPTSYGPGPAPTNTDVERFGAYSANLNNRVAVASDMIPRIQQAESALSQVKAGGGAQVREQAGKILQSMGAPKSMIDAVANGDLAATQEAEKYLFQTTFSGLKQSMQGDPARVAEFNAAENIFPSIGTDPKATAKVLKFMSDQGSRDFSEQQALTQARANGTFNPVTWESQWQNRLRSGTAPGVPASQVPGPASKTMPTGTRLQAYADRYTGGDTAKAQAALKEHGYQ
jgi:hypothetical protein